MRQKCPLLTIECVYIPTSSMINVLKFGISKKHTHTPHMHTKHLLRNCLLYELKITHTHTPHMHTKHLLRNCFLYESKIKALKTVENPLTENDLLLGKL